MVRSISVTQISRNLSEYLNRVAYRGERFVLLRGRKMLAQLIPVPKGRSLAELPDLLKSLPRLPGQEGEAFLKALSDIKEDLAKADVQDRWAS